MTLEDAITYYSETAKESRRKARIESNDYMDMKDCTYEAEQLADWLNELKTLRERIDVRKKGEWIPCNERLPEDGENVLVTYKTTDKIHPCQYHDDGSRNPWYSYIDQCRARMNVVLAWMPLPEPYRSKEETE